MSPRSCAVSHGKHSGHPMHGRLSLFQRNLRMRPRGLVDRQDERYGLAGFPAVQHKVSPRIQGVQERREVPGMVFVHQVARVRHAPRSRDLPESLTDPPILGTFVRELPDREAILQIDHRPPRAADFKPLELPRVGRARTVHQTKAPLPRT
ncbi:MAG: hypothetical protein MZV63_07345 [Marinilabiliales bacterium]|nr:hypothetical protein [Marinilabiliales bacterium]